jgi:hypothetical protein
MQGLQLSSGQRRQIEQRQQVRAFINPVLAQSVDDTIKAIESRKQQGLKPERVWFVDRQESGTLSIAEWMGY